jgi:ADP-ribose pyrophosphatase YjhB (NUDIX family)
MTTSEKEFLAAYDPRAYAPVAVTVDIVAFTIRDGELRVLLVERGEHPFAGKLALPGGFVRDETLDEAAMRELTEETSLEKVHLEQLATFGDPCRDPRMRVVSVAYLAMAPSLPEPRPGGDAQGARWVPIKEAKGLAFDHDRILLAGLERARAKLEYTPLATAFVADEFTIGELRAVYAAVWGEQPHAGNFHRKVLSVPGFVESTGATTEKGGERGGPKARLYRAGEAALLYPPLLRNTARDLL